MMMRRAMALVITLGLTGALAPVVRAETAGVGWEAFAQDYPTNLHPGGTNTIQIYLMNTGAARSSGPITVTDTLPEGVTVVAAGGMALGGHGRAKNRVATLAEEVEHFGGARWDCTGADTEKVTCVSNPAYLQPLPIGAGSGFEEMARLGIEVQVAEKAREGTFASRVAVSGGGAMQATSAAYGVTISSAEPEFGLSGWNVWFSNADGIVSAQAGSHPYETTFALGFNAGASGLPAAGEVRNIEVELPPGFFGEPNSAPRCDLALLDAEECPADTQIGVDLVVLDNGIPGGPEGYEELPVYNMEPPPGVADQFALKLFGKPTYFDTSPRGYGDYRLITHIDNIPQVAVVGNILTLWGVAPESSHDAARTSEGYSEELKRCREEGCATDGPPRPFLTLPTSCGEGGEFTVNELSSWEHGEEQHARMSSPSHDALGEPLSFGGCASLIFNPMLSAAPDTASADMPAGLSVNVGMPQEQLRFPGDLVEATIKNTTVTLPEGFVINPDQAAGLTACREEQARLYEEGAPECPSSSQVGTVKIKTPLLEGELEQELTGSVYVLAGNPPNLHLLIAPEGDGVYLKLVADVHLSEATGQLETTLIETPSIPFTSFELAFSGGAQAALATPTRCGSYTTTSDFAPWSTPFDVDAHPQSTFRVTSGVGGSACPSGPLPFSPELIAGATTDQAGGFTDFSLLLRRGDGQQRIERLRFKAPEGLSGMLSAVLLCGEPQAREGACSAASQIGHATVASGPGPYPLVIPQPGTPESPIYLTGPYDGAPFGLSIVTHVIAGPFDLGTIVTRAKIEVDPVTAQITITTDPLPQIIDGVPTDLRLIDSVIDRPGFMFNPTSCDPSSFSGTAWGTPPPGGGGGVGSGTSGPGVSAPIASRFQVGSCQSLQFKPSFSVSTSGKTSKQAGASLHVAIAYPPGSFGKQANIRSVKVDLPRLLPSRLTTLQKACTEKVFVKNPASCPAASVVGHAKVITPLLPVPLEGPAYFVSHGGLKFPELILVLQGDGVTIQLNGETFISKKSLTSSTFRAAPDQPVTSFELTLPQGPFSALAANGNLCKAKKLVMPTAITGQNGAVIRQETKIAVMGCPRPKAPRARRAAGGRRKR